MRGLFWCCLLFSDCFHERGSRMNKYDFDMFDMDEFKEIVEELENYCVEFF